MNSTDEGQKVVDFNAYKSHRDEVMRLRLPPDPSEAEELLNEIAHHLLMAVRAITRIHTQT